MTRPFVCITLLTALMAGCAQPVLLEQQVQPGPRAPVAAPRAALQAAEAVQRPVAPLPPQTENVARLTL